MKRRSRHSKLLRPLRVETHTADIHLRLCQRCLYLNESSGLIKKCRKCERPFSDLQTQLPHEVPINVDSPESLDETDPVLEAMSDFDNANEEDDTPQTSTQVQQAVEDAEEAEDEDTESEEVTGVNGLAVRW